MKRMLRSFIVIIISNSLIFLPLVNANTAEGLALPSGDLIAPEIKHTPISTTILFGELDIWGQSKNKISPISHNEGRAVNAISSQ